MRRHFAYVSGMSGYRLKLTVKADSLDRSTKLSKDGTKIALTTDHLASSINAPD
jgi:hypothetical protein